MNEEQELIYKKILKILKKYKNIYYSVGFGSFWQDYSNLKIDSDIDFFLLIDNEFSYDELSLFYEDIALISNDINYKLSPQIFVGDFNLDLCQVFRHIFSRFLKSTVFKFIPIPLLVMGPQQSFIT